MKSSTKAIRDMIPSSIDDILRVNRHQARMYLTPPEELAALGGDISMRHAKGHITNWCFVSFHAIEHDIKVVYLTGYNRGERANWMTSMVTAIAGRAVLTKSGSLYVLEGAASDQPDLLHICATLHAWGIGPRFGVPHIFY